MELYTKFPKALEGRNMPIFSIIMPVYNNEKYFPAAVHSVLSQSHEDFELIIVDDGSTDKTGEIADDFAKKDKRIQVIHQDNQWIYESFNNGISNAVGEYIYILNSDDRLRPQSLKRMYERIQVYHPDVILTKVLVHKCDEKQRIVDYDYHHLDNKIEEDLFFDTEELVRQNWFFFYENLLVQNQANLYKRELMLKHKFRNDIYGADLLFNISIAPDIHSLLVMKDAVYDFFEYGQEKMNASVAKYYSYEHDMFNEFYSKHLELFEQWGNLTEEISLYLSKQRLKNLTVEIRNLQCTNCPLNTDEKIKKVFCSSMDETVYTCANQLGAVEELEARVLSGIKNILIKEELSSDSEMYFVYELLESLLRYEKDEEDFKKIERAISHPLNRYHVGQAFYGKLRRG